MSPKNPAVFGILTIIVCIHKVNIIEIRPNEKLDLSAAKLLDFSRANIERLRLQGYLDTKSEMGRILSTFSNIKNIDSNNSTLKASIKMLKDTENSLDEIMKHL